MLSLVLLAIAFLPVVFLNRFAKIIRFNNFIGHGEIYVMCIVVPIVPALIAALACWGNLYRYAWLNSATLGAFAAIVVWFLGSRLLLCLPHKLRQYSISDETYAGIKKDLDVVLVGFIAAVTIVGNFLRFAYILGPVDGAIIDGAVKATSAAFVVWLAFDRVKSTWQTKNEKVKTEGASGEGVACKEQDLAVRD